MRKKYIIGASIFIIKWINEINDMFCGQPSILFEVVNSQQMDFIRGVISVLPRKIVSHVIGIGNTIYNPLLSIY